MLDSECQWVRARSARALWKINSDATEVLPTLLKELQCRPAGLLVADCLAAIGKNAQAAILPCAGSSIPMSVVHRTSTWMKRLLSPHNWRSTGFKQASLIPVSFHHRHKALRNPAICKENA